MTTHRLSADTTGKILVAVTGVILLIGVLALRYALAHGNIDCTFTTDPSFCNVVSTQLVTK